MKLEIHAPASVKAGQAFTARVILLNDSYEPVPISRNGLMGPMVTGVMMPPGVEETFGQAEEPLTLAAFTFYGRDRQVNAPATGKMELQYTYIHGETNLEASATVKVE